MLNHLHAVFAEVVTLSTVTIISVSLDFQNDDLTFPLKSSIFHSYDSVGFLSLAVKELLMMVQCSTFLNDCSIRPEEAEAFFGVLLLTWLSFSTL